MGETIDFDSDTALMREATSRIEDLEAKLAIAVDALTRIGSDVYSGKVLTSSPPQDAAAYFARKTIEKLKGEVL